MAVLSLRVLLTLRKHFDNVNYWKLFNKLLDDGTDVHLVRLFAYWYSNQEACVRWRNRMSACFTFGNGTWQGEFYPVTFARYISDLIRELIHEYKG